MILDVVLNIVAQLMFFIVNIFVIPWLTNLVIDKFGEILPNWLYKPVKIVESWTIHLLIELLSIPIMLLIGNKFTDFRIYVDDGELKFDYELDSGEFRWCNMSMLGWYLIYAIWILIPPTVCIIALWSMLPNTFSLVVDGLGQWTALQSGVPNLDYFKEMVNAYIDIIWNRLIMGGLNENAVLFVIFMAMLMLFSRNCINLLDDEREQISTRVQVFIMPAIVIILFNVVFAILNPATYLTVSYHINAVGMIILLVVMVVELLEIIMFCFKFILSLILKIKG